VLVNDPKDRHVLATAIRAGASTVVTFNMRDFSPESLRPYIARDRKMSTAAFLSKLARSIPNFASHVAQAVGWSLDEPNA
jgi:predicted nucleic acid-binding protein